LLQANGERLLGGEKRGSVLTKKKVAARRATHFAARDKKKKKKKKAHTRVNLVGATWTPGFTVARASVSKGLKRLIDQEGLDRNVCSRIAFPEPACRSSPEIPIIRSFPKKWYGNYVRRSAKLLPRKPTHVPREQGERHINFGR